MLFTEKRAGETPLELLERLRRENPALATETLSYAGRLDPMAEGVMLILVGEKENQEREKYLGLDKEYIATFMAGVATDTGDALGLITQTADTVPTRTNVERVVESLKKTTSQTYPWFSSQTVDGVPLFEHYKKGNTDIERPSRDVTIYEAELLGVEDRPRTTVRAYILETIAQVHGDFRQEEIASQWQRVDLPAHVSTFQVRLKVSSGTYIRALGEVMPWPATLLSLRRTHVFV